MQSLKWVHIPFQRGQVMLSEKSIVLPLNTASESTSSAWAMVLSNDDFLLDGRIGGLAFVEESADRDELRVHLGWLEHSLETRGRRARMVSDLIAFAWGRWIDAHRLFLVGPKGDGVALTREIVNLGENHLLQWTLNRMRATAPRKPKAADTEASTATHPKAPYRRQNAAMEKVAAFA